MQASIVGVGRVQGKSNEPLWKPEKQVKTLKPLKRVGKVTKAWDAYRIQYYKDHPPDYRGMGECERCHQWTEHPELDHVLRRGSHPELILKDSNIALLCRSCHNRKDNGMRVYD